MNLLYPLGLLGLIGIPILIIIYIIKNKYTEQVISSTYIWTLSEKFLKKRNPINKLVGIISLILQILAVLFVSVAIAKPVFTIPNAANEYVFILDGSGSMNFSYGRSTRLDEAKGRIASVINDSLGGSSYTLVYAGTTTETVFERTEDKRHALKLLNEIDAAYLDSGFVNANDYLQKYFDNVSQAVKAYLVTDKSVDVHSNVQLINVSSNEQNYALGKVEYSITEGVLKVKGSALSYESDAELTVKLYIDGENSPAAEIKTEAEKLEEAEFEMQAECASFDNIRVAIENRDALMLDNEVIIYSPEAENNYKVLLVSDQPFMLEAALSTKSNIQTRTVSSGEYTSSQTGYNLYIFDGVSPELPRDGAVWFFDPSDSVRGSGFSFQRKVTLPDGERLTYNKSSASAITFLSRNLLGSDIYVKEYSKCSWTRRFSTLLSYSGDPLVFAGTNTYGVREIVTAFDIHKSNLPVLTDFTTLITNYLNYTFPNVFDKTLYTAGESVTLNVSANCDSIRITSPRGNISYVNKGSDVAELLLAEVGVYTVTMTEGSSERKYYVYAAMPESERSPASSMENFSIRGIPSDEMKSGTYDDLLAWFIIIAVLLAADWVVYCYEQYQLR